VKEELIKEYAGRNPEMVYFDLETLRNPSRILMQATILYKHTTKQGKVQDKKLVVNVSPQFCPFCGKPYEAEEVKP